jgi:hypothetical protein
VREQPKVLPKIEKKSIYQMNKYCLKDLFENTPKFEAPIVNFSGNSNAPKGVGKLTRCISKVVL